MIRLLSCALFAAALPLLAAVPAAPTGLDASDGSYSNKIALSWEHVRDAQVYRVFRSATNDSSSATAIGTTPSILFTDNVSAGLTFFYWVRAENASGNGALSADRKSTRLNSSH